MNGIKQNSLLDVFKDNELNLQLCGCDIVHLPTVIC